MPHNFSNMARTLTRMDGFGEAGNVIDASGVRRPAQMAITRHRIEPADERGLLAPRFTIRLVADATLGVLYSELDIGMWKLEFADVPGGALKVHDIGRYGQQQTGAVVLEVFGAGI